MAERCMRAPRPPPPPAPLDALTTSLWNFGAAEPLGAPWSPGGGPETSAVQPHSHRIPGAKERGARAAEYSC